MEDEHFSHETVERFFQSELTRGENREFVRHLLRRCAPCSCLVNEVAHRLSLHSLVRGAGSSASRFDSHSRNSVLGRILRLVGRDDARQLRSKRPARAGMR